MQKITKEMGASNNVVDVDISVTQGQINTQVTNYTKLIDTYDVKDPEKYVKDQLAKHASKSECKQKYTNAKSVAENWRQDGFDLNESRTKPDIYQRIDSVALLCGHPEALDKAIAILEERQSLGSKDKDDEATLKALKKAKESIDELYGTAKKSVQNLKEVCVEGCGGSQGHGTP